MQTSPIYNFYSYEGMPWTTSSIGAPLFLSCWLAWGSLVTRKPSNNVLWMNLQDDYLSSGR